MEKAHWPCFHKPDNSGIPKRQENGRGGGGARGQRTTLVSTKEAMAESIETSRPSSVTN